MKRKYYLRGLGFGILITTLVFILTGSKEISDEEVIRRAEQLGYTKIEEKVTPTINLSELKDKATPVPENAITPEPTKAEEPSNTPILTVTVTPTPTVTPIVTVTSTPTPTVTVTPTPTVTPVPEPTKTPVPTEKPAENASGESIQVIVERGDSARVVCRKMQEAGVIENADDFRDYLVRNDMTDEINVGSYTFTSTMSFQELAKILTGR